MGTVAILVLGGLGGLLLADLLLHVIAARMSLPIFEMTPMFGVRRHKPDPAAAEFWTTTADGVRLAGAVWQPEFPARGVVVFCPELGSDRWSAGWYGRGLLEAGLAVVSFDFGNQGESGHRPGYSPTHWATEHEAADLQAVLDWVARQPGFSGLPLGLFGISRGGGTALAVAARRGIQAVAADGAFSVQGMLLHFVLRWSRLYFPTWFMNRCPVWHVALTTRLVEALSSWRKRCAYLSLEAVALRLKEKRLLLVSGARDTYVLPEITRKLHALLGGPLSSAWIVPGAKHNMARDLDPAAYDERLSAFFQDALGLPAVALPDRRVA